MTTKKTLHERVRDFVNSKPEGVEPSEIYKATGSGYRRASLYPVLYKLRASGEVRHDAELGKYYPMTSRVETKPAEVSPEEVDENTMEHLFDTIDRMGAVIRYLENRVEVLIRKQVV